ncbi:MAG: carboxypeptidase regulatory-like domain-containing protein, partial [Armatimonadota bacterium]
TTAAPARAGPVAVQAGRAAAEARIELREGATIQGQVLNDRGSRVAGAEVRWHDRTPREQGPSLLSSPVYENSGTTDAEGRFAVPRAAPGLWRFYAHLRGHLSGQAEVDVGEQGTYGATVTVIKAWSGTLEGRILRADGRTPVANTRFTLERFITRNERQSRLGTERIRTDADGRFSLDVEGAIHAVRLTAQDLTPTTVQIEPSDRETVSLSVRVPPVSGVRGTVRRDGTKIPADGLYVLAAPDGEAVPLPDAGDAWPSPDCRSARMMPGETRWQILGLEPGEYEVFTYAAGRAPSVPAPVTVAEGNVAEVTVDVAPEPGAIAGRVLTVFGEPVEGAYASARPSGGRIRSLSTATKTDEQGRYRIDGLTPGVVRVRVYTGSDGYAGTPYENTLVVSNETTENVDFEMFRGSAVGGVVKRRDGWPLTETYRIDLRIEDALRRTRRVREGGTFSFDRVYPGTYEVILQRSGEMGLEPVAKQEGVAVGDEETITDIEFVIDEE